MKLYSKISILFHFTGVVIMIGIGAVIEFIKEHYPQLKDSISSYIDRVNEKYQASTRKKQNGLYAV